MRSVSIDLYFCAALTALGMALAWLLAGGLPLIGIDDAAITRSYAQNLAAGHGYVYNIGGERVEGSTTLAWVTILTGLYRIDATPELPIIVLAFALTALALFWALRFLRLLTLGFAIDEGIAVGAWAVILLSNLGFFMWSGWTMMELSLWTAAAMGLLFLLARAVEEERVPLIWLLVACLVIPTIRPEGVALTIGLLVLSGFLRPGLWRACLLGGFAALASFVAITFFRLSYFGQPFPNTFYAKVSSDRLQGIIDGVKYLLSFVLGLAFAEVLILAWVVMALWAITRLREPGARATVLGGGVILGVLSVYAVLGGDHFALWRFYQPLSPLLPVAAALALAALARGLARPVRARPALAFGAVCLGVGWMQYYQARFDVVKEYVLVEQGLGFGHYLNEADPLPVIGVGPAGGIALAYEGPILDLLGLNWTVMAHANPVKVGMRNHASFHLPTFWDHAPDVVSIFNRPCGGEGMALWPQADEAFDGLFSEARFRESYRPVLFTQGDTCWPGFATRAWLDAVTLSGIDVLGWEQVRRFQ